MTEVNSWQDDSDLNEEHRKVLHRVRASIPSLIHEAVHPVTERVAAVEAKVQSIEGGVSEVRDDMRSGLQHVSSQVVALGVQIGAATGVKPLPAVTTELSWSGAPIGEKGFLPWIAFLAIKQPKLFGFLFVVMALTVAALGSDRITGWMEHWGILPQ